MGSSLKFYLISRGKKIEDSKSEIADPDSILCIVEFRDIWYALVASIPACNGVP